MASGLRPELNSSSGPLQIFHRISYSNLLYGKRNFSLWQYATRSYSFLFFLQIPLKPILNLPGSCLEYESQAD